MATMNFPANPIVGDKYTNSFGVTYIFTTTGTWDIFKPAVTLDGVEMQENKDKPNGYAGLNALGEIDPSALPDLGASPVGHGHNIADINNLQATLTDLETKIEAAGSSGGASLGNTAGSALGTASAGTSGTAARSDHVHPLPSLATLGAAESVHAHANASIAGAGFCPITKDNQIANGGTGRQSVLIAGAGGLTQWVEVSDTALPVLNISPLNHGHGLAGASSPGFMPAHNNDPNVPVWGALGVMGLDGIPFWAGGRGILNFIRETTLRAADIDHTHPSIEAALPKKEMYFESRGAGPQLFTVNTEINVPFGSFNYPTQTTGQPNDNMPGMWGGLWTGVPWAGSDFVFWTSGTYLVTVAVPFNASTTKGSCELIVQLLNEQITERQRWVFNGTIEATGPTTQMMTIMIQASRTDAVRVRAVVKGTGGNVTSPAGGRFIQGYKLGT